MKSTVEQLTAKELQTVLRARTIVAEDGAEPLTAEQLRKAAKTATRGKAILEKAAGVLERRDAEPAKAETDRQAAERAEATRAAVARHSTPAAAAKPTREQLEAQYAQLEDPRLRAAFRDCHRAALGLPPKR